MPRALNPGHPSLLGPQFHQQHCSGAPRGRVGKSSVNSHARYSHPSSCCLWPWSRSSGENAPLPDTQKHSIYLQAPVVGLNRLFVDCGWFCQIHSRPPPWLWGLQQVLRASVTSVRNEQAWLFSCTGRKGHFFRSKSPGHPWKNYGKFVSKTGIIPIPLFLKRLKTAGELGFFCDAEEFHLVKTVLKRKTKKEEKGKERKPFPGHLACRGAQMGHCMGPGFLWGWEAFLVSQGLWLTLRGTEQGTWGSFWTVSRARGKVCKQHL